MSEVAVKVEHISKKFKIYKKPYDRVLEWATFGSKVTHTEFWALQNINFQLNKGESLGIVGPNGAGKSTLLKILTGSLSPTTGNVEIAGRVVSLLELGTGFHPELTGLQNIYNSTSLLGFEPSYVKNKLKDIIEFSEIGEFLDNPVKTYSSGMYVRLAFSLFANLDPDIYIVDEALAVGDVFFQQKCYAKLEEMRRQGVSIILVSHDSAPIVEFCDYAMIIDGGRITESGDPASIVDIYQANQYAKKNKDKDYEITVIDGKLTYGNKSCEIEKVTLLSAGIVKDTFYAGEKAQINIFMKFLEKSKDIDELNIGIQIKNRLGSVIYGTNTYWNKVSVPIGKQDQTIQCSFNTEINLGPGEYTITVAASEAKRHVETVYCWIENIVSFSVIESQEPTFGGQIFLPMDIDVTRID
jgi:lipopolysaccharide transport system ATP-binding protein